MKTLTIKTSHKDGIYTLIARGKQFMYSFDSRNKSEFDLRVSMIETIKEYYENE